MATYKVIQDIEADDKLLGPLTLRQFIFAIIAAACGYFTYLLVSHHAGIVSPIFIFPGLFCLFFAIPFGKDQPTEIWALAKIRFLFKPRKRIWDQAGIKDLVTITVPKKVEEIRTNGLTQTEVKSRLSALATTIDSRGWSVKNYNVNTYGLSNVVPSNTDGSDRLIDVNNVPQYDIGQTAEIHESDDILDAQNNPIAHQFDQMINASTQAHHQQLMNMMSHGGSLPAVPTNVGSAASAQSPQDHWFVQQASNQQGNGTASFQPLTTAIYAQPAAMVQAADPTAEEAALGARLKRQHDSQPQAASHLRTIQPLSAQASTGQDNATKQTATSSAKPTPITNPAILDLASNNDLNISTLAREAHKASGDPLGEDEVVIALH